MMMYFKRQRLSAKNVKDTMTNDVIYKWLLETSPDNDNKEQWEELANTLWFNKMTAPFQQYDMSKILNIAQSHGISIPNTKTAALYDMMSMAFNDPIQFNFDNYITRITNGRG